MSQINCVFNSFVIDDDVLVVEFVVPGRTHADIAVEIDSDRSLIVIARATNSLAGSIGSVPVQYQTSPINNRWDIEHIRTVCSNGMLTITIPAISYVNPRNYVSPN
jgi:HSP20 family molecular chaperone IbpA